MIRIFQSLTLVGLLALSTSAAWADDSPQFRGPDRDGIYSASGLLESWPEAGPERLWTATGLGEGFATVSVADGRLYTTGMQEQVGTAFAFDLDGKLLWKKAYGKEHAGGGYPGTRTTPTVDGDRLFLLSSMGVAVALSAKDGATLWSVDLLDRFKGKNIYFGMSESPLVDGDRVIFTAGGKDAAVVALDKATGETVWATKGLSETSAYCNPVILDNGKHRQIVTMVQKSLVGLHPESGKVLWQESMPAEYDIHSTSPVIKGNRIYITHGYDQGGHLYELAADGRSVKKLWRDEKLDVHHGGAVVVGDVIYGAASKKTWYALDMETGAELASIRRAGKGAVTYADGLLYGYVESGDVLLVNPDPKDFRIISQFEIKDGEGQHWAHPVVAHGVLYIRHGDVLMAFDIAAEKGG